MRSLADLTLETLYSAAQHAVRIVLILVVALIASRIVQRSIPRLKARILELALRRGPGQNGELEKRAVTLGAIFRKTVVVLIWITATVMILREAGFDIAPILASAGVVGLAIGFGAQNLVRDIISGMCLLMENQIRVNDVVVINGTGGLVEEINLRTTVLRSVDGAVHIFPNGTIQTLSNLTHQFSYYVFDMGVAYKEDTDHVAAVMKAVADQMMEEEQFKPFILEPLEILGVDRFAESAVIIKARIKTVPIRQWAVGRELNRRFKKRFEELGIEIPFPQRTIHVVRSAVEEPPQNPDNLGA
ncbi:MAG: mechanosensitive ion channel family protein [Bryobacteraceae bacterium]